MRSELEIDERPLAQRVVAFRAELVDVQTLPEAQAAFLEPDLEVLRVIEQEFHFSPGPVSGLRDHLAREYMRRRNGEQRQDTDRIDPDVFRDWVGDVVTEWLPGYTDFSAELGGQYKINFLGDGTFAVTTPDGYDPRKFRVTLAVEELPAADGVDA